MFDENFESASEDNDEQTEIFKVDDDDENNQQINNNNETDVKEVVKPPKRVLRYPRPKLNEELLKGPKGIASLESHFKNVKFKGHGYEDQDLNTMMKNFEYWCHRLFPKYPFDSCIEKLEKLGHKKAVQTHVKRIRFDMLTEEEDKPIIDSSDEENNIVEEFTPSSSSVDAVQQITTHQSEPINNDNFDKLSSNTSISKENSPDKPTNNNVLNITEEQLETIRLNREKALKLKQARLSRLNKEKVIDEDSVKISDSPAGPSGINKISDNTEDQNMMDLSREEPVLEEQLIPLPVSPPFFDMESNIKGKSVLRGCSVKKKSKNKTELLSNNNNNNNNNNEIDNFFSNENIEKNSNKIIQNGIDDEESDDLKMICEDNTEISGADHSNSNKHFNNNSIIDENKENSRIENI